LSENSIPGNNPILSLSAFFFRAINSFLSNTVIYPDSWSPVWSSDENCFISQNGAKMETVLKTDGLLDYCCFHYFLPYCFQLKHHC
jgi:hypothetical protein